MTHEPTDDDAALIAHLLHGANARARASALLLHHDGLAGLARADPGASFAGLRPAEVRRLQVALELGRRALRVRPHPPRSVRGAADAASLLAPGFAGLQVEELHALYLDRRLRPLAVRPLTRGSSSYTIVDPAQILRPAVALDAAAVVLAHNHPSGDLLPSPQDEVVTQRVGRAAQALGVRLLDHLIVAGAGWTSMVERGAWRPPEGADASWAHCP